MSGGQWDYGQYRVADFFQAVTDDLEVRKRWPKLRIILQGLKGALDEIFHDMDWDLSGDTCIDDDAAFQVECLDRLRSAVGVPI